MSAPYVSPPGHPTPERPACTHLTDFLVYEAGVRPNWSADHQIRQDYAAKLRELASLMIGPVTREEMQLELHRVLTRELHRTLNCSDPLDREARADALVSVIADAEKLANSLTLAADRVSAAKRPNLISYLRARVIWDANDMREGLRCLPRAIDDKQVEAFFAAKVPTAPSRVLVRQLVAAFSSDPRAAMVLATFMETEEVAATARAVGVSRTTVYGVLRCVRAWIDRAGGTA